MAHGPLQQGKLDASSAREEEKKCKKNNNGSAVKELTA
jgi:hypothetical protein